MSIPSDKFELYAEFGIAAEKAQTLETAAGNFVLVYLGMFFKPDKPDEMTNEKREFLRSIVDGVNKKTLGTLLKSIKSSATFDQKFLGTIEMALERRNYLMHHFFRSHNFAIYNEEGRKAMIEELRNIQTELSLAEAMLFAASSSLEGLIGSNGITDEQVQKLVIEGKKIKM